MAKIPWWHWPALLALDPPAMTVLWLALFAHALHVPLEAPHYLITAGGSWLFLALNRIIRATWEGPGTYHDPRIRFFRAERWPLLTIMPFVLLSLIIMILTRLRWLEQTGLFALASVAVIYLVCAFFHFRPTETALPREIIHSGLITGLIGLFILTNGIFPPAMVSSLLVLVAVLFLLSFWSSSLLEWRDRLKAAKPFSPRLLRRELKVSWVCMALLLIAIALIPIEVNAPFFPILMAVAAAATNLCFLAWFSDLFSGITFRCLSRLMLLTPLVPLVLAWTSP